MIFVRTEFVEYFFVYSSSVSLFYRQTNDCNFVDVYLYRGRSIKKLAQGVSPASTGST